MLQSDVYELARKAGDSSFDALRQTGLSRMCCRRMLLSHPHTLEDSLLKYPNLNVHEPDLFLDMRCEVSTPRTMGCE